MSYHLALASPRLQSYASRSVRIFHRSYSSTRPCSMKLFQRFFKSHDEIVAEQDFDATVVPSPDHPYFQKNVRHTGIQVHDRSVGRRILPGNFVIQRYRSTGNQKLCPLEMQYGFYWFFWDLEATNHKPTLANEHLIPEDEAYEFSYLENVQTLEGTKVDLPEYFLQDGQCTFLAVSFREMGHEKLASWMEPYRAANLNNVKIVKLSVTEHLFNRNVLKWFQIWSQKRSTPVEDHKHTLLYFGRNPENWRDELRLHNPGCGYVFLLDDLARVRFAGSGEATEEEIERVVRFTRQLTGEHKRVKKKKKRVRRAPRNRRIR